MAKKIYVIAGEASGDLHGAKLIEHLRAVSKETLEIFGVGGDRIKALGVRDFFDLAHFHVIGFTDAVKNLPQYMNAERVILTSIQKNRPDLVVVIDNPGFNLHLAPKIHAMGIPLAYYITPQVWAWKPKRILKIKKYFKKALVVFDFEKKLFEDAGIPVTWVGHPLKDAIPAAGATPDPNAKRICLMPGSRMGGLKMLLPVLLAAAGEISKKVPGASFVLMKAPTLPEDSYAPYLAKSPVPVTLIRDHSYDEIRKSNLVIVCTGTSTLECALLGTPMIITNKGNFVTHLAALIFLKIKYLGLPNLVLNEGRIPELLQKDCNPTRLAQESEKLLTDTGTLKRMKESLAEVSRKLGEPGASKRAAQEVLKLL